MTYEYMCEACGHHWEAEQSIKDAALDTCVSCKAKRAKRLISGGTGFLLKGGGWYADGYGSSSAAGTKSTDSKPAPSEKSTDSTAPKSKSSTPAAKSTSSSSKAD